jgi:hypothetical protein
MLLHCKIYLNSKLNKIVEDSFHVFYTSGLKVTPEAETCCPIKVITLISRIYNILFLLLLHQTQRADKRKKSITIELR